MPGTRASARPPVCASCNSSRNIRSKDGVECARIRIVVDDLAHLLSDGRRAEGLWRWGLIVNGLNVSQAWIDRPGIAPILRQNRSKMGAAVTGKETVHAGNDV